MSRNILIYFLVSINHGIDNDLQSFELYSIISLVAKIILSLIQSFFKMRLLLLKGFYLAIELSQTV